MRLCLFVVSVVVGLLAACPGESPAEGEGEGESAEGEGEGEGEAEPCNGACVAGERCGSIFGPSAAPSCFVGCADGGLPCETAEGAAGECRDIEGFDGAVCRSEAANLEACGNDVAAGCLDDNAFCVGFNDAVLFPAGGRLCIDGCAADAECGAGLGCSFDARFTVGDEVLGSCVAPHGAGTVCGRLSDGSLVLCTGGLRCLREADDATGTCGTPS